MGGVRKINDRRGGGIQLTAARRSEDEDQGGVCKRRGRRTGLRQEGASFVHISKAGDSPARETDTNMHRLFRHIAERTALLVGTPWAFMIALFAIIAWAGAAGPGVASGVLIVVAERDCPLFRGKGPG